MHMNIEEDAALPFAEQGDELPNEQLHRNPLKFRSPQPAPILAGGTGSSPFSQSGASSLLQTYSATANNSAAKKAYGFNIATSDLSTLKSPPSYSRSLQGQPRSTIRQKKSDGIAAIPSRRMQENTVLPLINSSSVEHATTNLNSPPTLITPISIRAQQQQQQQQQQQRFATEESMNGTNTMSSPQQLPRVYVPGFTKHLNKQAQQSQYQLFGQVPNKTFNIQTNSAKNQRVILENIAENNPQANQQQLLLNPMNHTRSQESILNPLAQKLQNISTGSFQILLNRTATAEQLIPFKSPPHKQNANSAFGSLNTTSNPAVVAAVAAAAAAKRRNTNTLDSSDPYNFVEDHSSANSQIRPNIKTASNEIYKMVTPNAYKMLKVKMSEQSSTAKSTIPTQEAEDTASDGTKVITLNDIIGKQFTNKFQDLTPSATRSNVDRQSQNPFVEVSIMSDINGTNGVPPTVQVNGKESAKLSQHVYSEDAMLLSQQLQYNQVMTMMQKSNSTAISAASPQIAHVKTIPNQQQLQQQQQQLQPQQFYHHQSQYSQQLQEPRIRPQNRNSRSLMMSISNGVNVSNIDFNNESAILSQEKAILINEINGKKSSTAMTNSQKSVSFYSKFISRCLEQGSIDMQMQMSPTRTSSKKKEFFETDLEKIKTSSQLLDVIDKELFSEPDQVIVKNEYAQNVQNSIASKRVSQKKLVLSHDQKEKLFQVLADSDKIVVHTSQNKDLMVPSERKDVVRLAQWLEEMLEKIYNIKDLDFFEYFENMQLVCSACMSELIRQIGVSVQERGQLTRRVWESILHLMKQAFEQLTGEKIANEKQLKEEIKSIHKMYLGKLDEYIPLIEKLQKQLDIKEQTNKRVVLEFRYLRKKDAKLEKYLKLAKKDLRLVEEDYNKLEKEYDTQKATFERQENEYLKTIADLKKISTLLSASRKEERPTKHTSDAIIKLKGGFDQFNKNYEAYNADIQKLTEQYDREVRDFNQRNHSVIPIDQIENMEEAIYSNKAEVEKLLLLDERIIEEIGGSDGIKLLIGHCGVQTGPDLLKMTDVAVDTQTLVVNKDRTTQTHVAEIDVKEVQTPVEWMKNIKSHHHSHGHNHNNLSSLSHEHENSILSPNGQQQQQPVISSMEWDIENEDEKEIEKKRQKMEEDEQMKLEKMTEVFFRTEDQETEERERLLALPFVRDYLNNDFSGLESGGVNGSGSGSKSNKPRPSLTGGWKDEDQKMKTRRLHGGLTIDENPEDDESDKSIDSIDEAEGQTGADDVQLNSNAQMKHRKNELQKKIMMGESIANMVQNTVERDLDDLHMLVMSRTAQMNIICQKILKFDLLKENDQLEAKTLSQFIEDSQKLILEENSRLKRIWQRSRNGLFESIKNKLLIAEKDAELEEVQNDKVVFEESLKQQIQGMLASGIEERRLEQSQKLRSPVVVGDEKEVNSQEENGSEGDDEDDVDLLDVSGEEDEDLSSVMESKRTITDPASLQANRVQKSGNQSPESKINASKLNKQPTGPATNLAQALQKKKTISQEKSKIPLPPTLQSNPSNSSASKTVKKKKETINPLNRVSVSLIEAVMAQRNSTKQESEKIALEKRFTEVPASLSSGAQKRLMSQNQGQNWLKQVSVLAKKSMSAFSSSSLAMIPLPTTSLNIGGSITGGAGGSSSSSGAQGISPNADSAALFFNKIVAKFMGSASKASQANGGAQDGSKRAVLKQQNVVRHIANIYLDKMRLIKNGEESVSRTLNVVTYDYFLNQFGFKKLAETKLKQFLDSAAYYSVTFKVRMFTKLYGINRIMNYDFEDFDIFIKLMLFLEEGSTSAQLAAGMYPMNRATEALFRHYETKIPSSELMRLKQEMDSLKVLDATQKQKNKFAIDADSALDILLQALVEEKKICIQNIQSVYLAGDVNCDHVIGFDEFLLLYRHFEADSYTMITALAMYYNNCDLIDRYIGNKIMSFQKFTLMSVSSGLFTKASQDSFAGRIQSFDRIANIEALERFWEDKKDVIRLRLVKNSQYKLLYRQMIIKIDDYFKLDRPQRTVLDRNSTWFTYRLLDEEKTLFTRIASAI